MASNTTCKRCGQETEILRHPVRHLRFTRYWGYGVLAAMSKPLRACPGCGSIYRHDGALLAAGATRTAQETQLVGYRDQMRGMRDSFGSVFVASQLTVAWTVAGPLTYDMLVTVVAGGVGAAALVPCIYFARKVREARRELRQLKQARREGTIAE